MAHSKRAQRALAYLPEVDPGLASLALWCTHRDGIEFTRTQGDTIFYGEDFTGLPLHEQVGLLGHHVLHVALRHSWRMGALAARRSDGFDADLFNRVADALINDTLLVAGHGLPRPCVTLDDLDVPNGQLAEWDVERLYFAALQSGRRSKGETKKSQRDLAPDPSGDAQDPGAANWRNRLERAKEIGKQAGRGIGSHTAPLGDLPDGRIPWEKQLRRLTARYLSDTPRQTHRRPARSWIAAEAQAQANGWNAPPFEPAILRRPDRPLVVIALDTSGSIDAALLQRFASEIVGIAQRCGANLHLLAFDETVHADLRLAPEDLVDSFGKVALRREGGTCFDDVLSRADQMQGAITIVMTDLDGPIAYSPKRPILWVCPGHFAPQPPFGRVVLMGETSDVRTG